MGSAEEQAQNELRKVKPRTSILLRQEHYPQNLWKEIRVQVRLQPGKSDRLHPRSALRGLRLDATG